MIDRVGDVDWREIYKWPPDTWPFTPGVRYLIRYPYKRGGFAVRTVEWRWVRWITRGKYPAAYRMKIGPGFVDVNKWSNVYQVPTHYAELNCQ